MPDDKARTEVNLQTSICTDTPTGTDLWAFGDPAAKHINNTGIERNGGIQNLYLKVGTFTTAGSSTVITKTGQVLQVDASNNVRINNQSVGNVGPYAISLRGALAGYADAAWTTTNTIIGILKVGSAIQVDEFNPTTGTVINTRSTTFAMPAITITNLVLVKYVGMAFADSLQFIIANSSSTYTLTETGTTVNLTGGVTWTARTLASNGWNSMVWSPSLGLFVGVAGGTGSLNAVTSPDGINWTQRTIGTGTWTSVAWAPQLSLFCAGSYSSLASSTSPDGVTWTTRSPIFSGSSGIHIAWSPSQSIFAAVNLTNLATVAASSTDGINWTARTLATANWAAVVWGTKFVALPQLSSLAATSADGVTWVTSGGLASTNWSAIAYSPLLALYVAVGLGPAPYAMSSPDGSTWTIRTLATAQWTSVAWAPELSLFVAVNNNSNTYASSSDGINWTVQSMVSGNWGAVTWSPSLLSFAALSQSGGANAAANTSLSITNINFAWRFGTIGTGATLVGHQGSGGFAIGTLTGAMTTLANGTWAVIDQFAGTAFSQAVLTFPMTMVLATQTSGIAVVGYTQAGTLSTSPTYYGPTAATFTVTVGAHAEGPGYSESVFTRSDVSNQTLYYQAPIMGHQTGLFYDYQQQTGTGSSSGILCNGFGRLNDFTNNALGNTCALRVLMTPSGSTSGIPTTLAAAQIGAASSYPVDCIGVPITLNGEFDSSFVPHVVDNGSTRVNLIYRYNGVLIYLAIQSGVTQSISKVSDKVYMINCLSPNNCVDVQKGQLFLGANDYNGRILMRGSAAQITTTGISAVMQGQHAYSIDNGIKQTVATFNSSTCIVPGIALPTWIDRAISDFGVNIYWNSVTAPVYNTSFAAFNVTYTNPNLSSVAYTLETSLQPLAMGYTFYDRMFQTELETVFLGVAQPPPLAVSPDVLYDYLGYMTGNQVNGSYQSFTLYGQMYLFDGISIFAVTFTGSAFAGKGLPVATETGLTFIAVSPTMAYFLSAFDNSVFVYTGGRELVKRVRMNALETVQNGAYNVRDNTLMLQTSGHFVIVRDDIVSYVAKAAAQTSVSVYDSTSGLIVANNTAQWQYTYASLAGSTVLPLDLQTGYMSVKSNMRAMVEGFNVYIHSATNAPVTLSTTVYTMDADRLSFATQPQLMNVTPAMYDTNGVAIIRVQPKIPKSIAVSLRIQSNQFVTITRIVPAFKPEAAAVVPADRSA